MSLYLTLCIILLLNAVVVWPFLMRESYNQKLKDDAVYRIDEPVNDDYGMMDHSQTGLRDTGDTRLASKEYDSVIDTDLAVESGAHQNNEPFSHVQPVIPNLLHILKRNTSKEYDHHNYYLYDYNQLFEEYYEESLVETKSNKTYHPTKGGKSRSGMLQTLKKLMTFDMRTKNCTAEELTGIGFKPIYCLYIDYRQGDTDLWVLVWRFLAIARIWFYVYLAVAIAFWCTKGWCCCCLFCKFLKPRHTIEEAKRYLANNPPGVILTARGHTVYEPTVREIERYEEFEHFLRTV